MDESTDNIDVAQLCIFSRYLDNTSEEKLTILLILGTTCRKVIHYSIIDYFEKHGFDMQNLFQ